MSWKIFIFFPLHRRVNLIVNLLEHRRDARQALQDVVKFVFAHRPSFDLGLNNPPKFQRQNLQGRVSFVVQTIFRAHLGRSARQSPQPDFST